MILEQLPAVAVVEGWPCRTTGGAALSQCWLWHFDAHWPVLTNPAGPFSACTPERHVDDPSPLPSTPVPAHVTEAAAT